MKTDELIELLARGAGPAPRAVVARRLAAPALGGLGVAAVLAAGIGLLPMELLASSGMLVKQAYAAALAAAAGLWLARIVRPAAPEGVQRAAVIAVFAAMLLAGAMLLMAVPDEQRSMVWMGRSWRSCPWLVALLSLPALALLLTALREFEPLQPRRAGLAAGLLAGSLGMGGYALHCPEQSPTFVAIWYTAGVALIAALGAVLGPRVLRR